MVVVGPSEDGPLKFAALLRPVQDDLSRGRRLEFVRGRAFTGGIKTGGERYDIPM